jgi:hypothetical protein
MFASDSSSLSGAERLCREIETFWQGRGLRVTCSIVRETTPVSDTGKHKHIYSVRSNLTLSPATKEANP